MTEAAALEYLATFDGRDIIFWPEAQELAGAFGFEPIVYPLSDSYFDGAVITIKRRDDVAAIMALDLLVQIARHQGVSIQSPYLGRERRYLELLSRMHRSLDRLA